jgi:hypothetical protein
VTTIALPFLPGLTPEPAADAGPNCALSTGSAVYVDAAIWPYGRMTMCHMLADNLDDLHAMADRIGVARRWFQNKPGFPHYDICKAKRALAVQFGAVEVDRKQFVALVKRFRSSPNDKISNPH